MNTLVLVSSLILSVAVPALGKSAALRGDELAGNSTSGGHPMRATVGEPRSHVDIVTPHMMMNNTEMRDGGEDDPAIPLVCGAPPSNLFDGTVKEISIDSLAPGESCELAFTSGPGAQFDIQCYNFGVSCARNQLFSVTFPDSDTEDIDELCRTSEDDIADVPEDEDPVWQWQYTLDGSAKAVRISYSVSANGSPSGPVNCIINGITGNRDPDHEQETFPADNDADASERLAKLAKMGNVASPADREESNRIVNGGMASDNEYPWKASLYLAGGRSFCGGSIISAKWIMSAAHCLELSWSNSATTYVVMGTNTYYTYRQLGYIRGAGWQYGDYNILFGSGWFSSSLFGYDIAIARMTSSISPDAYVTTTFITSGTTSVNQVLTVAGWGRTCGSCGLSAQLKEGTQTVISDSSCIYGGVDYNTMTCANPSGSQAAGTCNGDSGGWYGASKNGKMTQYGIVSFGAVGCPVYYPSGFTEVGKYAAALTSITGAVQN